MNHQTMQHGGIFYDESGRPTATSDFNYACLDGEDGEGANEDLARLQQETARRIILYFVEGAKGPAEIGRRVLMLGHLMARECSQRELAKKLGVSPSAVSQRLTKIREYLNKNGIFWPGA